MYNEENKRELVKQIIFNAELEAGKVYGIPVRLNMQLLEAEDLDKVTVLNTLCKALNTTRALLTTGPRNVNRQMASWFLNRKTSLTKTEIAQTLGIAHCSVIVNIQTIDDRIESYEEKTITQIASIESFFRSRTHFKSYDPVLTASRKRKPVIALPMAAESKKFVRPKAEYSNSSPYGVATESLMH